MQYKLDKKLLKTKLKSNKVKDKIIFHNYLVDLLDVKKNSKVLDLGCGHGGTMIYLSKKIGPSGKLVGVDKSTELLGVAEYLLSREIKDKKVELKEADLDDTLPFGKNTFDRIVCHNVLECIDDKIDFINQCYSILKKGGILVMSHGDWDSQIYNSSNNEISRKLVHNYADTTQSWMKNSDGTIGRKLKGIFHKTKFKKIEPKVHLTVEYSFRENDYAFQVAQDMVEMSKLSNEISKQDADAWLSDLIEKNKNKEFYYSYSTNIVVARK